MRGIKNIYVVGRKNPDLDSVASAVAYAELKNTLDAETNYVATVCGGIDETTQKVFGYYNIPFPKYIADLSLRVEDVMTQNTITVRRDEPVTEIFRLMLKNDLRVVPVVKENGEFVGYFGMIDIAKKSISSVMPDIFRKIKTSISIIKRAVDGETIVETEREDDEFIATIIMGVVDREGLMNIIERIEPESVIMVVGNREDLQRAAIEVGVRCIVISHGYDISDELKKLAEENGVAVISSEYDAFATVGLIEWGIPVESVCEKSETMVNPLDLIKDIKEVVYTSNNRAVVVVDTKKRVKGIITRTDIIKYDRRNVILIDHSSSIDAPDGIFECNILEIIDHHRLGDIQTGFRTRYRIEPWGATASIIVDEFKKNRIKPSKTSSLLLAAGIIVNTKFLTENVVDEDMESLEWICSVWEMNSSDLSEELKRVINS
ncbi:DRTGG domain-containing protein [Hippea alviniae]|uniref:DRTGG domain-containing protein n=1 Tax=Hippea alviniae TaxID=1279027 RepID=UPI0003B514BB|nr:DRTGG domain-containing protein [Hippea alviniae]